MSKPLTLHEAIEHSEAQARAHDGTLCGTNHQQLAFWLRHYRDITSGVPVDYAPMLKKDQTPKVGVGIIVRKGNCVLLGMRKGSHGAGEWGFPGGHQKISEGFWMTCSRELREETGLSMTGINRHIDYSNDDMAECGLHYVTLYFDVSWQETEKGKPAEPRVMEPDMCEEWRWFPMDKLPSNLWGPVSRILEENYLAGELKWI